MTLTKEEFEKIDYMLNEAINLQLRGETRFDFWALQRQLRRLYYLGRK